MQTAINTLPAGRYAVGVSGGADSVCLLHLLHDRAVIAKDLTLHIVHLDHQLRDAESDQDAAFVRQLADTHSLPMTISTRTEIEAEMPAPLHNASARYRAARIALFHKVVEKNGLQGVILGHHAADQAETIMLRLLRGTGVVGLHGMSIRSSYNSVGTTNSLCILRPLLAIWPSQLRAYLESHGMTWREDASNASPKYQRNRVRAWLSPSPELSDNLLEAGEACQTLQTWLSAHAPRLAESFPVQALLAYPDILAEEAARRWLIASGSPAEDVRPEVVGRLLAMARDAAAPARQHFPGKLLVRRRRGVIWVDRS